MGPSNRARPRAPRPGPRGPGRPEARRRPPRRPPPPPGPGTIRLCRLRCRRAARAPGFELNLTCAAAGTFLAPAGGHQPPHPGRLSFPQHGYGTLEPRSAASAAPRAPRTWAARGAPIRHLCIVGTVAPRRGPFGHVRLALSRPWTWCRRWTAPGGLVAPFDPGDRPILKGA